MALKGDLFCGTCVFFKRKRLYNKTCSDLGYIKIQSACVSFEPDISILQGCQTKTGEVCNIFESIKGVSASEARIIAHLLLNKARVGENSRFKFLQPVYLRYQGSGDYLSHYCRAYVLDATETEVKLLSVSNAVYASVPKKSSSSVYTITEFKEVRQRLRKKEHIIDHNQQKITRISALGRMATLDDVYKEDVSLWEVTRQEKKLVKFLGKRRK